MIKRKLTKQVNVGGVKIGGGSAISVQSMTKSKSVKEIINEIKVLEKTGCDLVRIAVPNFETARQIKKIKQEISIPLIADIHFNHLLAIESIKAGADKIRINPGNIGGKEKVKEIVRCLKDYYIPMRVGVNSGSLEADLLKKYKKPTALALTESIVRWVKVIEDFDFDQMVLSVKSADLAFSVEAYRIVAQKFNYPLHIGITEASGGIPGIVRSAIGIGILLAEGIGDTIRVSLTGSSMDEVKVGKEILMSLGLKQGIQIISCPTCGRCSLDVQRLVKEIEEKVGAYCSAIAESRKGVDNTPLRIAVMGCIVNGPGEAKEADFGVTGSGGTGVIFKNGKIIKKVAKSKIVDILLEEIKKYIKTEAKCKE
ncbi:MAG: flavodoxin-dependent (E)-4-hydroxy-3-methylbut-2-enyl-diphosphate synthase [Candidatus Stahlbacteria bacterium]|nr:flavodoxin-dependent (E)-4-hydroxy-3-methylbut-2-enyl-diphosphate synthase [Candidatus Stahlbacteria bacterium]